MNEETVDKEPSVRRRFGRGGNRVLTGVFLLVIGALLMAKTAGVFFSFLVFYLAHDTDSSRYLQCVSTSL
jgi:hypothetical protein